MNQDNENKLLLLVGGMDGKLDDLLGHSKDHESRLRNLERWNTKIIFILVSIAAFIGKDHIHTLLSLISL